MPEQLTPASFDEAAAALAGAAARRRTVRIVGGDTKRGWGNPVGPCDVEIHTAALDRMLEHNEGDLTAVLEAGVPLADAQRRFAGAGQMLAIDPFLGSEHEATIGGVLATADSGPFRHRYGAPRDLILGITVALSDGTIARAGGKVIKNVAGYDLGKLFCGSLGTLGLILSVSMRLHPLPAGTATALGVSSDPEVLAEAARLIAAAPLELEAFDVAWRSGRGGLLAQFGGVEASARAARVGTIMRDAGLGNVEVAEDDAALWARQRAGQRSSAQVLVRVSARPSALPALLRAVQAADGTLVGRAGLGQSFVELDPDAAAGFLQLLPPGASSMLLDAPGQMRATLEAWHPGASEPVLELTRRIKARFDPARACNPGVLVGGI